MKNILKSILPDDYKQKGLTLVEVAIVLVILGLLIGLGASLIGPLTKRAKINETKENLSGNIEAITSWSAGNKRLPKFYPNFNGDCNSYRDDFRCVIRSRNDSWGKQFYYVVDNELVQSPSGTEHRICDRRTTKITVRVFQDANNYQDIANVAFIIISSGENYNNQTFGTQQINNSTTIQIPYPDAPNIDNYSVDFNRPEPYDDIVKWITLDELRIKVGCQGAQLKILNNELPYGYVGSQYNATVYAEGGVPFTSGGRYQWCREGSLPSGLNANPSTTSTDCANYTNWGQSDSLTITGTPNAFGTYNLKFYSKDSEGNLASRAFVLTINPSSAGTGCASYRVWNQTGGTFDFRINSCLTVANGSEITTSEQLIAGGSISRYNSTHANCPPGQLLQTLTYSQAQAADTNGNCQVNFTTSGFTDR